MNKIYSFLGKFYFKVSGFYQNAKYLYNIDASK